MQHVPTQQKMYLVAELSELKNFLSILLEVGKVHYAVYYHASGQVEHHDTILETSFIC